MTKSDGFLLDYLEVNNYYTFRILKTLGILVFYDKSIKCDNSKSFLNVGSFWFFMFFKQFL